MKTAITALLLGVLIGLAGCVRLPQPSEPVRLVAPQIRITADPAWPNVPWTLAVQRPISDQTRGSARIVVRSGGSRLSYYPGLAWLDEMPDMLQALVLQGFVDSGRIPSAGRPGTAQARYGLATEVRRFDAVDDGRGLTVELELQAGLVELRTGRMLAARVFTSRAPVSGSGADRLTEAYETALGDLVRSLVGWTLTAAPDAA
jgi:cholesterol transport system auxiliary component